MMRLHARPAKRAELARCLVANELPSEDLSGPGKRFFAFTRRDGARVGFGGLELCGTAALLRSVVSCSRFRCRGYGRAIVDWLVRYARHRGIRRIYLLTMTAPAFFERCGFRGTPRVDVPARIAVTEEFRRLCPSEAICMVRDIARVPSLPGRLR